MFPLCAPQGRGGAGVESALTRLSSSGLEEKMGLSERTWWGDRGGQGTRSPPASSSPDAQAVAPTCLAKAAMSSLKEPEEQTSLSLPRGVPGPEAVPWRGEHVASSHFSKTRASSGKSGCLGLVDGWLGG